MGHRDAVEVGQPHARLAQRPLDDGDDHFQVAARGELGDDAAVGSVHGVLGGDDAGAHAAAVLEDGRRGLVT